MKTEVKQTNEKHVVTLLPWLKIQDSLEVKSMIFWRFPSGKRHFNLSEGMTNQLKRILRSYRDLESKPIEELTIVSLINDPLKDLTNQEVKEISTTIRLAAFSVMAENDYYLQGDYFNSSHFQHFHQRFQLGSRWIAPHTRRRDGFTWHGGYKHGELKFIMPLQTSIRHEARPNVLLLGSLVSLLEQDNSDAAALRQAINWFFLANSDTDFVSWETEIIMMASAFEALFQVQDKPEKKNALMAKLPEVFSGRYTQEVKRSGTDGCEAIRSWKVWWIDEFYWLRNKISHGGKIDTTRMKWTTDEHLTIAAMILSLSIKLILASKGSYSLDPSDEVSADAFDAFISDGQLSKEKILHARNKAGLDRAAEKAWTHIQSRSK